MFRDHDGRKIVDAKGNVLYQNHQWAQAANGTDAYRVDTAMMATSTGSKTWNEMAESSIDITYRTTKNEKQNLVFGEAVSTRNKTDITIYEGSIDHLF